MPSRPKPSKQAARGPARSTGSARTTTTKSTAATSGAKTAAKSAAKTPARSTKAVPAKVVTKAVKPAAKAPAKGADRPAAKATKAAAKAPSKAVAKTPAAKGVKAPAKTAPRGAAKSAADVAAPALVVPDDLETTTDRTLAAAVPGAVELDDAPEIPAEPSAPEPEPIPEELSPEEWFRREKARRTRPATADVMAEARELLLQAVAEAGPRRGRPVRVGAAAKGKPTKKLAPDEFELEEYRPGEKKVAGEG